MARSWLVDSSGFAKKVKFAILSSAYQIKDCGAYRECPNCHHLIDNKDVFHEWPGLPTGVKFHPSDDELLEHLAAKCGIGSSKPHKFINEFIPTLEGDGGIYYTHPENLPGAKKDGSSVHFFHRIIKAYTTGNRKRRKIDHHDSIEEHVRWHKTGKTKPVLVNGVQKGFRKIMVLYGRLKEGSKPNKSNWVMHQYHLGCEVDEKDGEYVVSKIFFQQSKQIEKETLIIDDTGSTTTAQASPGTPKISPPNPSRPGKSVQVGGTVEDNLSPLATQDVEFKVEGFVASQNDNQADVNLTDLTWLAGESQDTESCHWAALVDPLLCNENTNYPAPGNDSLPDHIPFNNFGCISNDVNSNNLSCGIADLESLEMDTPPDFHLSNLQFSSLDSVFDWVDRL